MSPASVALHSALRPALWHTATIVVAGAAAAFLSTDFRFVGAMVAAVVVWAAAKAPRLAVVCAIPVLLFPAAPEVADVPVQVLLLAALEVGVLLGCAPALGSRLAPAALVLGLAGAVAVSHVAPSVPPVTDPGDARNHLLALLLNLGLVVAVMLAAPDRLLVLTAMGVSGTVVAGYCLAVGTTVGGRLTPTELNPNSIGHAAALAVVALAGLFAVSRRRRWLLLAAVPLALVVASQSRGGLVVLLAGSAALWLLGKSRPVQVALALVGTAAAVLLWGPVQAAGRLLVSVRDPLHLDTDIRSELVRLGVELTLAHPVTGVGYRQFVGYSAQVFGFAVNAHNEYVRVAAESGLIALALLLALVGRAFTFPGRSTVDRAVRAVLLAGLVSLLFTNAMTDLRVSLPIWVLLGMAWATRPADDPRDKNDSLVH